MNIFELDNHNLQESAKFKDSLNPTIWDRHENLKNAVRDQIMIGAEEYCSYLGLSEAQVKDILVAGRSAGYDYSLNESIDVVVVAQLNSDPTFREFFNENKYRYNRQHPVKIGEHYVKFYVQPSEEPLVSRGAYSVLRESWVQVPVRRNILVNDTVCLLREAELSAQPVIKPVAKKKKIVEVRKPVIYGYGPEEINEDVGMSPSGVSPSTKMFLSEEPKTAEEVLQDFIQFCSEQLELANVPNFKVKRDPEWSKRNKTFGRFNQESGILEVSIANRHLMDVLRTVAHELVHQRQAEIAPMPAGAGDTGSDHENEANALAGVLMRDYGQAHPELFAGDEELEEGWKQKAAAAAMSAALLGGAGAAHGQSVQGALGGAADVARTAQTMKGVNWGQMLGGEAQNAITQYSQTDLPVQLSKMKKQPAPQQQYQSDNGDWSGNSDYKRNNPAFQPESVQEDASGYIPTKKQANDPRYKMALTVDVKPGTLGKVANAYKLNTDSQGRPQIAKANGMVQRMKEALELYKKRPVNESTGKQVLSYIKKIHPRGEFTQDSIVTNHPEWELTRVPLNQLKLQDSDGEVLQDPYGRILDINYDHVEDITKHDIENRPIVADNDGWIIDGNHRAEKARLLGLTSIPAYVPVESDEDDDEETYDQFMARIAKEKAATNK